MAQKRMQTMKFLLISGVALLIHVVAFFMLLFAGNASLTILTMCSAMVWSYPATIVALYRMFAGRANVRIATLNDAEYNAIMRRRQSSES